ncbi:MAG: alpha/beta hydrolase, partial [Kutzneria sp.]|nr:alpha/beta hydrolase [Kutzneria sp.]
PTSIARFTRTDDAVYPPAIAARIKPGRRVLVTCGTADVQVPCSTIGPLVGALVVTGTHGPGLTVLPGIDHDLHPQGTPVNDPILAPAVERALHAFARPWATH